MLSRINISVHVFPQFGSEQLNILSHVDAVSKTHETVHTETSHRSQANDKEIDSISFQSSHMLKEHLPK